MNISTLRRTAAEIIAAAVFELYPDIELRGGGETDTGFFYDFFFPHPIHASIIEERIRQIVREKRPIKTLEMVPFSAQELLKSQGHYARAEEVGEGLVELIQIGSFYDLCPGPHLKNTAELAAFKISAELISKKEMRIRGWCHRSKDELKSFLKLLEKYVEPSKLGETWGFWKGEVWLPPGLKIRRQLIHFFKKEWFEGALELSAPQDADRPDVYRFLEVPKVGEVLNEERVQVTFLTLPPEDVISSLHLITKTLTILGFEYITVPKGRQRDYLVEDGIGRSHSLVQARTIVKKGATTVDLMLSADVEKILSLLLEKNLLVNIENK